MELTRPSWAGLPWDDRRGVRGDSTLRRPVWVGLVAAACPERVGVLRDDGEKGTSTLARFARDDPGAPARSVRAGRFAPASREAGSEAEADDNIAAAGRGGRMGKR